MQKKENFNINEKLDFVKNNFMILNHEQYSKDQIKNIKYKFS